MLVSKFSVPIFRDKSSNNLRNILARCASKKLCSDDIKRNCPSREKTGGRIIRSRCEENRAAVEKCPRKTCTTDSPIVPPKCSSKISDIYLHSLKSLENEAKKLSSLIEKSVDRILKDFEEEINHKKTEQAIKRQDILKDVNSKIWELVNLDGYCGIKKRNKLWMINYKVSNQLDCCKQSEKMKFFRSKKEKLMSETKSKTSSAIDLLKSCRKYQSPNCFKDCVEDKTNEAIFILECANQAILKEIGELQNLKITAVNEFANNLENLTNSYKIKLEQFSKDLSHFLDYVKKQKKVKRK